LSPHTFALLTMFVVLLGFAGTVAFAVVFLQARGASRMHARLQEGPDAMLGDEFSISEAQPWLAMLARRGRRIERLIDSEGQADRLLIQAGWRDAGSRLLFYASQVAAPSVAVFLGLLWWIAGDSRGVVVFLASVVLLIASLLAPVWTLRRVATSRRARIKAEVPLFIHLLVLLFEAGLSTRQAIASLVREGRGVLPELGREFELLLRSLDAGGDTADLLRGLGDTLEVPDLTAVLSVLRQVDRYGGEIREPLTEMMNVLEQRRDLELREMVNLLSGRITLVMVAFFFPALLIFVAGPAVMGILKALGEVTAR
jgi:tight adherence protein C